MFLRLITPVALILLSIGVFIGSLLIPKAQMGNPSAPMYFPLLISIILFIMSFIELLSEWKKRRESLGILEQLRAGRSPRLILGSLILCILYSLVFEKVGFLFSTVLFLGIELSLVNGYKKWLTNGLVSIIFSLILWYGFTQLLGVSLP